MKKIVKAVLVAAGFLAVASSASAQGAVGQNQPPDQWVMNCNNSRGRDCTVSAMIDGGPDNLLGTFLIVSYSVAYTTLSVVIDGMGQRASMQVDAYPFVSTSIFLTDGDVVDSSVAIAAVPTRMPSIGIDGNPYACAQRPDR